MFIPRPLRLEYEKAWYHVMNRGAAYQEIFKTNKHRQLFLDLLEDASSLFGIRIHAYCLMNNHYHLLVNTPRGNLSQAMRNINGLYTQRFNRLVKRDGPLFRGRYKAIVVDHDSYLLQVSRYIHLNPVEAKLSENPYHYRWSSFQYYFQNENKPAWLQIDKILSMVSNRNKREKYALYVIDINRLCANFFDITENELCFGRRGIKNDFRKMGMYACRMWGSEKLSKIAESYHCNSHGNVANAVTDIKKRLLSDRKLAMKLRELRIVILGE